MSKGERTAIFVGLAATIALTMSESFPAFVIAYVVMLLTLYAITYLGDL